MRHSLIGVVTLCALVLGALGCGLAQEPDKTVREPTPQPEVPPAVAETQAPAPADAPKEAPGTTGAQAPLPITQCGPARKLLEARRFTLDTPHRYNWMKDHPAIEDGTLIVVDVDPECARPRQSAMPVLYAGKVPVEIANRGYPSGRIVAIVPGYVNLAEVPIYYGSPTLPERVDEARGEQELAAARSAGFQPFVVSELKATTAAKLADSKALYRVVADLIDRHAPDEKARAQGYRR
jgi:hypothetical protein